MKNGIALLLCMFGTMALAMQQNIKRLPEATRHVVSLDGSQEQPAQLNMKCGPACVCLTCINKASDQLVNIKSKLPFLAFIRKQKQLEGGQAIAAAQMIIRAQELVQEIKRLKLKTKTPKNIPAAKVKESKLACKEPEQPRPATPLEFDDDFAELTNPSQRNFSWLLEQAHGDI